MTHEEKAKELVERFMPRFTSFGISKTIARIEAKQCALICVDEKIKSTPLYFLDEHNFLGKVKKHIDKL